MRRAAPLVVLALAAGCLGSLPGTDGRHVHLVIVLDQADVQPSRGLGDAERLHGDPRPPLRPRLHRAPRRPAAPRPPRPRRPPPRVVVLHRPHDGSDVRATTLGGERPQRHALLAADAGDVPLASLLDATVHLAGLTPATSDPSRSTRRPPRRSHGDDFG